MAAERELNEFFDGLYRGAERDHHRVPWARGEAHPDVARWVAEHDPSAGGRALVVACGLGDDAVPVAAAGWDVTAFDVSPTAIEWARTRHPDAEVDWQLHDLYDTPRQWRGAFGLVVENLTIQSLPPADRDEVCDRIASWVAPQGHLLVSTFLRRAGTPPGNGPPWPLAPEELDAFEAAGLTAEELHRRESPEPRHASDAAFVVFRRSGDGTVVVTRAESPFEADTIVAMLRAHGIRAHAQHRPFEDVTPMLFSRSGTPVWVPAPDLGEARALLATAPE